MQLQLKQRDDVTCSTALACQTV